MWRTMFSRTTMASSISTPMASDRPSSVIRLSVKPHSHTAMKAVMADVGSDSAVISVERHELRNTYTTKIVSIAPSVSEWITLFRLSCASSPPSRVTSSLVPGGSVLLISSTILRTLRATATVLASRERVTEMLTLGCALRTLKLSSSAKPSTVLASWPSRTTSSPRRLTMICANSAGDSMRPTSRMLWSLSGPTMRPTGAVVFWLRTASTTSATDTLYSRRRSARSSTDSSRLSEPVTLTMDTPSTPRNLSASTSSASREIAACVCVLDDSAMSMIG